MKDFDRLVKVVQTLRKKCPWDKKQTHKSLKPYMVEETNEAIEAIDEGDPRKLCEELGDQLLHIVMHAEMAREEKAFSMEDIINGICAKMMRRHPHVFSKDKKYKNISVKKVLKLWEEIKKNER
ncbi:nucleotide pyrophosphohydrolase [Candidatus Saganbacteria bacterium]|nr:nucleotide pyrophosphohydrolase [Candidatus Saganbacteria bacterium]